MQAWQGTLRVQQHIKESQTTTPFGTPSAGNAFAITAGSPQLQRLTDPPSGISVATNADKASKTQHGAMRSSSGVVLALVMAAYVQPYGPSAVPEQLTMLHLPMQERGPSLRHSARQVSRLHCQTSPAFVFSPDQASMVQE